MSKERDWVDYAQLGLSAVQAASLSHISGQMGGLATELASMRATAEAQAQRARSAQEAQAAKARRVNQMRQIVWISEQFLTRLERESQQEDKQGRAYVYSLELEDSLKTAGIIPPDSLDEWTDKDRVGALMSRIADFQAKVASTMGNEQRREAELCWQFISEDKDLDRMIEDRADLESRQTALEKSLASFGGGAG